MIETYKEIKRYDSELTRTKYDSPFSFDDSFDNEIQNEFADDFFNYTVLMRGTINLINRVVSQAESGKPFTNIFFLDKSARPAAYLFRKTWLGLTSSGQIPKNLKIPQVNFINIGRNDDLKHNLHRTNMLAKNAYSTINSNESNILLIDEYVYSGGSIRLASKTFRDLFDIEAPAMEAYSSFLPDWYSDRPKLGITDSKYDSEFIDLMEKIPENNFLIMKKIVEESNSEDDAIEGLVQFVNSLGVNDHLRYISMKHVYQYFNSAGGFFSTPYGENKERLKDHRKLLRDLVQKSLKHIRREREEIEIQQKDADVERLTLHNKIIDEIAKKLFGQKQ